MASSAIVLLITAVMFLVVEGASSVIIAARGGGDRVPLERAHTVFDRELGWVNAPGVHLEDLYGKGRYLQTNSQRFRNKREFDQKVPRDKIRAVCTGDSFTLGYGVSNDDAWCELLGRKDSRLETVNMGQGGYGVDQAYLWYRRDGLNLEHDALIFAFIADDFGRMMCTTFLGYPKPFLSIEGGKPVIKQHGSYLRYLGRGLRQRLQSLRNLRSMELWRSGSSSSAPPQLDSRLMTMPEARAVAVAIFEDLAAIQTARKQSWMVVLLPRIDDYEGLDETEGWRAFLSVELEKRRIPFLDLILAMRELPRAAASALYRGHYNEAGNQWAADRIYDALAALPRPRERLQQIGPPARPIEPLLPNDGRLDLEPVSLSEAHANANQMSALAALAIDGSLTTRWHSGSPQSGKEQVVLDLGKPMPFRQVKLELGAFDYDYGRRLALDAGDDEALLSEVLSVSGERATVNNVDAPYQDVQVLTLPKTIEARFLRIRQTERTDENFWSIAEIGLYREK